MTEEGNLPIEIAREPEEEACLSQSQPIENCPNPMNTLKGVTFAEATPSSQNSTSTYQDVLSQPAPGYSHRQRLLWLQKRRTPGLWVQCDDCDKWRFLSHVIDAHELPAKWQCKMNTDKSLADCAIPEKPLRLREEEDLIHGEYSAGSVVWARLAGWPWWPAMVDDCPDTEQYYWLDGFSDIPTHYNVVFFDAFDATRAWIAPENLKPFGPNKKFQKALPRAKSQRKRMEVAIKQAEDAEKLPHKERLAKFSFISTYPGSINKPKKITKHELQRFQSKLKRKYNIDFPGDNLSEDDDEYQKNEKTTVIKKSNNVLLVGTPKSKKKSRVTSEKKQEKKSVRSIKDSLLEMVDSEETKCDTEITVNDQQVNTTKCNNEITAEDQQENTTKCSNEVTAKEQQENTTKCINEITAKDQQENTTKCNNEITAKEQQENTTKCNNEITAKEQQENTTKCINEITAKDQQENTTKCINEITAKDQQENNTDSANDAFKQPNSMLVQVGSTLTSTAVHVGDYDNDTSATYLPGSESDSEPIRDTLQNIHTRAASPNSDDFEF